LAAEVASVAVTVAVFQVPVLVSGMFGLPPGTESLEPSVELDLERPRSLIEIRHANVAE